MTLLLDDETSELVALKKQKIEESLW